MSSLNKVLLMGNLTRDPEIRHTPRGTAVAELSMAINRSWRNDAGEKQEEVTFVEVTLWGKTAELAGKYLAKGRGVFIEGRLQMDTWEDKDTGKKRQKLKIIGEGMQFLPGSGGGTNNGGNRERETSGEHPPATTRPTTTPADNFQEDDDIPF